MVSGSRRSLHYSLREVTGDLEATAQALLYRLGTAGSVGDDVLGWAPDRPGGRVRVQTGGADPRHRGLRRSVEFLESQPWLPDSARHLAESVLQAVGLRSPATHEAEVMQELPDVRFETVYLRTETVHLPADAVHLPVESGYVC